jgi:hypothetical protein
MLYLILHIFRVAVLYVVRYDTVYWLRLQYMYIFLPFYDTLYSAYVYKNVSLMMDK